MRVTNYGNEAINLSEFVKILGETLNFPEDVRQFHLRSVCRLTSADSQGTLGTQKNVSLHLYISPSLPTHITLVFKDVTLESMRYIRNGKCKTVPRARDQWGVRGWDFWSICKIGNKWQDAFQQEWLKRTHGGSEWGLSSILKNS